MQAVVRDIVAPYVVPHVLVGPIGQWVEFDDAAVVGIEFHLVELTSCEGLATTEARDPGI